MIQRLTIGKGKHPFTLPLELVTSTQAILARKRSGKSYTGSVQAEELLEHKQQVIVFDPTSAWYGLRSSADGDGVGYPIVVFGGGHEDAPLDHRTGKAMAAAVVENGFSAIFDIGNLHTEEQVQFVMDFCSELLRINRSALHVFMDEADTFAPQKPLGLLQNKCLGTVSRLVKQGGIRGVGFTMITQRPASMNKDVLSQVDILTVLRMSHPLDIKAATDWIKSEVSVEFAQSVEKMLPRLQVGSGYFCSASLNLGELVDVRLRRTFNSGATPKPGERRAEPTVMAGVDIEKLGKEIAASVQKSREESPEYLKQKIATLELEIAKGGRVDMGFIEEAQAAQAELEQLRAKVTVIPDLQEKLSEVRAKAEEIHSRLDERLHPLMEQLNSVYIDLTAALGSLRSSSDISIAAGEATPLRDISDRSSFIDHLPTPPLNAITRSISVTPKISVPGVLGGPSERILGALAQFRGIGVLAPGKMHVCLFSGYSNMTSKGFANALSSLRTMGLVDYPGDGAVCLTADGIRQAPQVEPIRGDRELHERIFAMLSGPESRILRLLISKYPKPISKDELMTAVGYTNSTSKGFSNSLSRLSSLGFVRYPSRGFTIATEQCFVPKGTR